MTMMMIMNVLCEGGGIKQAGVYDDNI